MYRAKKKFRTWSELKNWRPTFTELVKWAKVICEEYTTSLAAQKMKDRGDDWMAHDIYFICDALLFCEFEQAVAFADTGRVLRVMKYWAFAYHGCGQHNYARECAEVLLQWKYELDEELPKALERSWFVNRWGIPGRAIGADLYLEQLNFWVKVRNSQYQAELEAENKNYNQRVFIATGNGVTIEYIIEKGSACVEAFQEINERMFEYFGKKEISRCSKEIAFQEDMRVLIEDMERHGLH